MMPRLTETESNLHIQYELVKKEVTLANLFCSGKDKVK